MKYDECLLALASYIIRIKTENLFEYIREDTVSIRIRNRTTYITKVLEIPYCVYANMVDNDSILRNIRAEIIQENLHLDMFLNDEWNLEIITKKKTIINQKEDIE